MMNRVTKRSAAIVGPVGRAIAPAILLALLATGCERRYSGPMTVPPDEFQAYPRVTISQATLADALRMQEPLVERVGNDNLQVTVPLRSRSDETLHIEYRVRWLDAEGRDIPPAMTWRPARVEPRQPFTILASSTSATAEDYNVQIRWGRP